MVIAQWNDSLATGVDKVDTQHKEIIRMINESHEALSQGKGRVHVEKAIGFLSSYVVDHFKGEEELMAKHDYPARADHVRQHEAFLKDFTRLVSEYNTGGSSSALAINFQQSVVKWLVNHIMKVDKDMAEFLIAESGNKVA
ncbi:MAG: bacteriohemerythrin [Actinomycetota bacterium]|nr:bacteriohemerythrin [Actinomycetota bacterium]